MALLAVIASRAAQAQIVDQGSFTITVADARAGRETFVIRRSADGYQATGTVLFPDRRLTPALGVDSSGAPTSYQVEVRAGTERTERVTLSRQRGVLSLRALWSGGESAREFPAPAARAPGDPDGTILIDDDVVCQFYFLALGHRDGPVTVVVPRRRLLSDARVERVGADSVTIGGQAVTAEHLRLTGLPDGDRDAWVDTAGRVLRVAIPGRKLVALRDERPRP